MSTALEGHDRASSRVGFRLTDYATGIGLLLAVVVLWTSSNFVTQSMFTGGYEKPFVATYTSTSGFLFYLLPFYARRLRRKCTKSDNYQPLTQDTQDNPSCPLDPSKETPFTHRETAELAFYFCFLWFAANWALNAALAYTSVASATVLSSMSGIFTLAVGRIFRVERVTPLKMGAVLVSFVGVIFVSLSDSSSAPDPSQLSSDLLPVLGDILALFSAFMYAVYMIFLKVRIRKEERIDMQLFFGFVGLFDVVCCWPIGLVLHLTGIERFELPSTRDTVIAILANMFITLSSDYLYVLAMLRTTPLVVTIGLSLTIPLAVFGDIVLGRVVAAQVVLGAILVFSGFVAVGIESADGQVEGETGEGAGVPAGGVDSGE